MACQYFVGGRWVSENEFKALLNDGLLDTLVASKKLNIKGFKVDSSKAKVADKKIIERTSVPPVKLAEILAQEIKSRQGYAPNMLSALELNEDLTDFKIPLWASPYADKFESLLTSIVSNKVVKQKLPGNSYVLGSEEGFKVKEGDAAAGNLKDSNIVFTSKFDPTKGLQPMRVDPATGKILPAQIMIPFKLRNERGEILNIEEFMIPGEDGRKMLDMSKIPDKLLNLFGFRIPTQERNSMAAVEVVGFLPEAQGDLILAPRDFTKQMGSDFDVDKLYTYMYNHFYQNGKFYINFLSDPKKIEAQIKIAKESLKELRESLNLSKEENKILRDYINNTVDSNEEGEDINNDLASQASEIIARSLDKKFLEPGQIETLIDRLSVLNRSYTAARQNKILDIHLDVMTSNNPDVIASIIALDSFGEFDGLSKEVNRIRSKRGSNPAPLTILSDIYQRTKFINATAGKDGVGAFSLDSTFNAASQGKELVYENLSPDAYQELYSTAENPRMPTAAEMLEANNPVATFGDVVSKGDLSNMYTLRSQALMLKAKQEKRELTKEEKASLKFKSTIIRALQSTAVDNEKEQILDKLNINADTFSVIRAMTMLGFEEQDIAGLITQDIIWEYLAATKANRSTTSKYNANFQEELMQKLYAKYDPENKLKDASPDQLLAYQKLGDMSGERLIKNLEDGKFNETKSTDYNIGQLMMLEKFLKLDEIGGEIKKIQSAINTSSKGVPKSLLETNTKVTQIENLGFSKVFNAPNLLQSTINGYASEYGTMFADKIYEKYFPYKTAGFQALFKEVLTHIPSGSKTAASTAKLAEVQGDIFEDIKSYFYSNQQSNLFLGNPDEERRRLFIDKEGENKSLATILQEVSEKSLSEGSWYQKNQFLNKLSFNFNSNGDVSRVNFESSNAANFDERSIYAGFAYLLSKNVPLGEFNGIQYTTRLLAQDLITAAFLEGGIQGSKQYLRYIPIGYLKTLGFGSYLGNINFDFLNTFGGNIDGNGYTIYSMPSNFTRQYMQNNPSIVKTVGLGDLKGKVSTLPQEFELDTKALEQNFVDTVDPVTGEMTKTQTHFLTIRDNNKNSKAKYALYEFDEASRKYRRIPVLEGSYGFTQYNSQNNVVIPVFAEKIKDNKPSVTAPGTTIQNIPVKPTKKFDPNVVNNPAATVKIPAGIDTTLTGVDAVDDIVNKLIVLDDVSKLSKILLDKFSGLQFPDKFKVVYTNDNNIKGNYNSDTKVLTLNLNHPNLKSNEDLALLIAHELTHVFTSDAIKKFQAGDTANLSKEELDAVTELQALQMSYLNYIQQEGKQKEYEEFIEKYKRWKTTGEVIADNDSISKYYGAAKLTEFVTMALTDRGFQAYLNNVKIGDQSFMAKLKSIILDLLNAMGIDIKPGSALAAAVKSSMDLIEATQAKQIAEDVFYTVEQVAAINTLKENGITILEMDGVYDVQDSEEGIVGEYIATLDQAIELGKQILAAKNIQPKLNVIRKTYTGKLTSLQPNQIFVFGSNPEGRHGAGAAKYAKDNFGAIYGQGEGLQGQSYALPTKDLRVKENNGLRSISTTDIITNIKKLYAVAKQNPTKEFLVSDYSGKNLNGYTGQEMADMFSAAGPIPSNIIFNENFNKLVSEKPDTKINIYAGTGENAELSNFSLRPFVLSKNLLDFLNKQGSDYSDLNYKSVEQAFQNIKVSYNTTGFSDSLDKSILSTTNGAKLKQLGRQIDLDVAKWNKDSSYIMKELILASFEQNPDALAKLLATGNATLTHTQDKGKWGKEFPKLLMEVRDELRSSQPTQDKVKEGVLELFESNPELSNIGTQEQYSQYLDSIFPNSKVKDIVYRATTKDRAELKEKPRSKVIYTTDNKFYALNFKDYTAGVAVPMLVNTINPAIENERKLLNTTYGKFINPEELITGNIDSVIGQDAGQKEGKTIVVTNPEQIHILGSKQDIEEFKNFVTQSNKGFIQEPKYELFPGVYANAGQREAIDLLTDFLSSDKKEFLLQGKGGTGKTTIIKKILEEARKQKLGVLGVAPTHKAKKILDNSLGTVKTVTLASALAIKLDESTGNFVPDEFARSNRKFPLKGKDLVIIDESSMISDKLLQELRSLADSKTKIIFMGDRAQLPPVGQESDSEVFGVNNGYELTEKMRQAATSPIIGIGTKVAANVETTGQRKANPITQEDRVSKTDSISGSSITWESNENKALDEFANDIKNANGNVNYAKIVTFNNQNHNNPQSVKNLNAKVRRRLFGEQADVVQFMPGEILTAYETYGEEDPAFFNSEDLVVQDATELGPREYTITASSAKKGNRSVKITLSVTMLDLIREDGTPVPMPVPVVSSESKEAFNKEVARLFKTDPQLAYKLKDKFANLEYGYAVTSHKAQGSTYTNVYVMEDNIMGPSNGGSVKAKNQSLYVAVSRPTTKLVMVSNKNGEATTRTPLDLGKLSNVEAFEEPMGAGFNDEGDSGPSLEDWELFNNLRSDDSMITRELDEEMYQKYLLICGK